MHAEIVTTGTELLLGVISDTNSTYIARQLRDIGLNLYFITSAGDNQERVAQVINTALSRSDVVITTGGLGPTVDDITREAVAQATGRQLVLDAHLLEYITAFFQRRGFKMTDNNRRQAQIPEGAIPLENPVGTAPCFIVQDPRGIVISLPGVPREMKYMLDNVVVPYLKERLGLTQLIKTRTLKACGIGESALDALIVDLEESANPTIGLSAHPGQVDVRIGAKADSEAAADAMLSEMEARLRQRIGEYIYGLDDDTLEAAVLDMLQAHSLALAVIEVDAGGLLSGQLAHSDQGRGIFRGGQVLPAVYPGSADYTDQQKEAAHLAEQACVATGADIGLAAINRGPDEVFLCAAHRADHADQPRQVEKTLRFRGHEEDMHLWIASYALDMVRRMCLELSEKP